MTEKERISAIEYFENSICETHTDECDDCRNNRLAMEALEKQIPKKPNKRIFEEKGEHHRYLTCSECNNEVRQYWESCPYCSNAIDWSENG